MNYRDPPVLILGSGLTALGVLRSLGRAGLTAYSVCAGDELAAASRWYQQAPMLKQRVPAPNELAEYLGSLPIPKAVLMPCSDDWTRAVAQLSADLRTQYPASVSPAKVIEIMTDKWQFAQMLEREDLPRPKTIPIHSVEELAALPDDAFENMFLKPLDSQTFCTQTGTKAFQVESRRHAVRIMTELQRVGYDGFPILLQEYVPGPVTHYFLVDGFIDRNGNTCGLIARRRQRMYPARFGNSTLSETIPLSDVQSAIDTLDRIWSTTQYRGIFDAEFKYDERDGQFKIVEINARPWWFVEFADRCGMTLCSMAYRDALNLPVAPITTYRTGRRCAYAFYDFAAHRATEPGLWGAWRWLCSLRGSEEIVFCRDDPRPGLRLSAAVLRKLKGGFHRTFSWNSRTRANPVAS